MGKFAHIVTRFGAAAAGIVLVVVASGTAFAAAHPRLVSVESSKCSMCHANLTRGTTVIHAPVESDCSSCHRVSITSEGTTVELVAPQPGLCVRCHGDLKDAAAGNLKVAHAPVSDSCLICHVPHAGENEHLLKASGKAVCIDCHQLESIKNAHAVPVARANCVSCHSPHGSSATHMLIGDVVHAPFGDGSCQGCHRVGRGTKVRLRLEGAALCYACHSDLELQFSVGSVHSVVADGNCLGCHNPHMGNEPKMLLKGGSALCFECHEDIKEKVEGPGGHEAAKEGCKGCHDPHHSDYPNQLLDQATTLCLRCHGKEDARLSDKHLGVDLETASCVGCHDPHGSNHEYLIADGSIHAPFLADCGNCHEGSAAAIKEDGGKSLCFGCHSEIEESVQTAAVPHDAIEKGQCIDCHNPHASLQPSLLRRTGGEVCTSCHQDQKPGPGEHYHGVIPWFGCQSCHLPHGGPNPNLLKESGNLLCLGCHLSGTVKAGSDGVLELPGGLVVPPSKVKQLRLVNLDSTHSRNHPIPNHPVAGFATGEGRSKVPISFGEISCLSCHVPHTAGSKALLAFGAKSSFELCMDCHPK
jgi:predicted CXXCH cytochrome family protein